MSFLIPMLAIHSICVAAYMIIAERRIRRRDQWIEELRRVIRSLAYLQTQSEEINDFLGRHPELTVIVWKSHGVYHARVTEQFQETVIGKRTESNIGLEPLSVMTSATNHFDDIFAQDSGTEDRS